MTTTEDSSGDRITERLLDLKWKAQAGVFYHQALTASYESWLRRSQFVSLFFALLATGSVGWQALATKVNWSELIPIISLALVILLALNQAATIAFDVANLAVRHKDLARDWLLNLGEIDECVEKVAIGEKPDLLRLMKRQTDIDEREPPTKARKARWAQSNAAFVLGLKKPERRWFFW